MWNRGKTSFSNRRTRCPARASTVAAVLPPGPPPMTMARCDVLELTTWGSCGLGPWRTSLERLRRGASVRLEGWVGRQIGCTLYLKGTTNVTTQVVNRELTLMNANMTKSAPSPSIRFASFRVHLWLS